jgi:hypothetical protein
MNLGISLGPAARHPLFLSTETSNAYSNRRKEALCRVTGHLSIDAIGGIAIKLKNWHDRPPGFDRSRCSHCELG